METAARLRRADPNDGAGRPCRHSYIGKCRAPIAENQRSLFGGTRIRTRGWRSCRLKPSAQGPRMPAAPILNANAHNWLLSRASQAMLSQVLRRAARFVFLL